jgi:LAS superfamily LD-carboxypeptidase LdcB
MKKGATIIISVVLIITVSCVLLYVSHAQASKTTTQQASDTDTVQDTTQQTGTNTTPDPVTQQNTNTTTPNQGTSGQNTSTTTQTTEQFMTAGRTKLKNWWNYPTKINAATRSGDDLLVLVNKFYKLSSKYAPSDLVAASGSGFRTSGGIQVRSGALAQLKLMHTAAKAASVDLSIMSGYRSYTTQVNTYKYWVGYLGSVDAADKISARAGHSQHQLGTAIDFSTKSIGDQIGAPFNGTAAQKWLAAHAWEYGFALSYPSGGESTTGYSYESWHYRFIGVDNAKEWKDSGKLLEVWLEEKN